MCEARAVNLEMREYGDVVIPVGHGFELLIFQVRGELHGRLGIHFDQHELVRQMFLEVCQMCNVGCDFCKVSYSSRPFRAQLVRFNEDSLLLDPRKKIVGGAAVLDAAKGAVAEESAADADVRFILFLDSGRQYVAEFLEFVFASRERGGFKNQLFIVS